jgi:hypothetical protein
VQENYGKQMNKCGWWFTKIYHLLFWLKFSHFAKVMIAYCPQKVKQNPIFALLKKCKNQAW